MGSTTWRRRAMLASAVLITALLAGVTGAFASHQFSDVPNTQPHHANIGAIVDSGCATGFNDNTYRPGDNITRGQAASFLTRCGTRGAHDDGSVVDPADNSTQVLASVTIKAGATGAGTGGFVLVFGDASFAGAPADCTCTITAELRDNTDGVTDGAATQATDSAFALNLLAAANVSRMTVFPIDGDETKTFQLRGRLATEGSGQGTISGELTAIYVPFDGDPTV